MKPILPHCYCILESEADFWFVGHANSLVVHTMNLWFMIHCKSVLNALNTYWLFYCCEYLYLFWHTSRHSNLLKPVMPISQLQIPFPLTAMGELRTSTSIRTRPNQTLFLLTQWQREKKVVRPCKNRSVISIGFQNAFKMLMWNFLTQFSTDWLSFRQANS